MCMCYHSVKCNYEPCSVARGRNAFMKILVHFSLHSRRRMIWPKLFAIDRFSSQRTILRRQHPAGFFVEPAWGELDIVATTTARCMCVHLCMHPSDHASEFIQTITSTIGDGFQNNVT